MKNVIKEYLKQIGSKGGKVKSQAKAKAAKSNGKKGGRPKGGTMKKILIIFISITGLFLNGCNRLNNLIDGSTGSGPLKTVEEIPAPFPLPLAPVLAYGDKLDTLAGFLADPYINVIQANVSPTVAYVRRISDGTWRELRITTSIFSSSPYYMVSQDGIELKKLHGYYDAYCLYVVR